MRLIDADKGMERIKKSVFNSDMETTLGVAAFEGLVKSAPTEKAVAIDETFEQMMISAVRYALGRRTYIVNETVRYIQWILPNLSDWCIDAMKNDIDAHLRTGNVGTECDMRAWERLRDALNDAQKEVGYE